MVLRLTACALLAALAGVAAAQTPAIPRTPSGHPDFQGVWSTKWRTPLERQKEADGPVVSADKVPGLVAALDAQLKSMGNLSPDVDFDWGPFMPAPGGGFRTSMIVEPADGKRPLTQMAKDLAPKIKADSDKAEGPEARGATERCLHGSGATPFAISPGNQNRQIVETADNLVVYTEDISDLRIIRMSGESRPGAILTWNGDSIGHWDGETLVIETSRLRAEPGNPSTPPGEAPRRVTERLRFNTPDEIVYSYTIEDPQVYASPMSVEFLMLRSSERMFEVACHEANYSLAGILSGARAMERRAAKPELASKVGEVKPKP
ncbi:MAG TPA: hypothetical protein VG942_07840 [Hyphomonadaceae bacterium]|nr:hypothetical protein [Hyphomonadaceae bacterium]